MERLTKRIEQYVYYTQGKYEDTLPVEMETNDIRSVLKKLAEYEDLEEQGLLLRLPCKLGDIIDRIISHNEIVTLMFETEVSSFRYSQHFWTGMAWNIPKEYLELPFVKIHGVVPDKITEADTIWIEVKKEAEQAMESMVKENGNVD